MSVSQQNLLGSIFGTLKNGVKNIVIKSDFIELSGNTSITNTNVDVSNIANNSVTNTEFQYLNGLTSSIQSQIDSKQNIRGNAFALTLDTSTNATSTSSKNAQPINTGIFYQNGTQLRVQYKSSNSYFNDIMIGTLDTTSPVITILGDNPASVTERTTYTDAGATAIDGVDGDVTSAIDVSINVDTSTTGTNYSVTYTVSDNAGNIATAIRTVYVVPEIPTPTYQWDFTQGSMPSNAVAVGTVSFASDGMTTTTTNHARLYSTGTSDFAPSFFDEFSLEFFFKTANFDAWKDFFVINQPQSINGTEPNRLAGRVGSNIYGITGERFMIRDFNHTNGVFAGGKFNATDAPLATNTFYHVVYTHKNNPSGNASRKLYLNDTLQTTTFGTAYGGNGDIPTTGNNYSIKVGYVDGYNPNQSDTWKYFRIYNSELPASDVAVLYTNRNN